MITSLLLSLRSQIATLGIFAATLLALAPQADAQCFTPDGYTATACCASVTPSIPAFPAITLPGKGICWTDCTLSAEVCTTIVLGAPNPSSSMCTQYKSTLEVFDCTTGGLILEGDVTLDYTRTWSEQVPTSSLPIQVWRFAAKVDMTSLPALLPTCPVPDCAIGPGNSAFYYGYVDYTLDCVTGTFDTVLVLYHGCDEFIHKPGFSAVPGSFHAPRTFALVAPNFASNPFTPGFTIPPAGVLVNEAMRTVTPNAIGTCFAEEHIQQGFFQPLVSGCLCPLGLAPSQQSGVRVGASGICGSEFKTLNLWPVAPWFELVITSIGRWSNSSSYPGPEFASVAEGLIEYREACDPTAVMTTIDIFYGGFTIGGYSVITPPTIPPSPPLSMNFLDIASNYSIPAGSTVVFPLYGVVNPTDHLIYVNP
jgi:hypothetical protein